MKMKWEAEGGKYSHCVWWSTQKSCRVSSVRRMPIKILKCQCEVKFAGLQRVKERESEREREGDAVCAREQASAFIFLPAGKHWHLIAF